MILKCTSVSQGTIQSMRDIVAKCPPAPRVGRESRQPKLDELKRRLKQFHVAQTSDVPEALVNVFGRLNHQNGGTVLLDVLSLFVF